MFNKIIKAINGDQKSDNKAKVNENNGSSKNTFAGYNRDEIKRQLEAGQNNNLSAPKVSDAAQNSLETANNSQKDKSNQITSSSSSMFETVATIFSEGDLEDSISRVKEYINLNKGNVEKRYWYMLLDMYQIADDFKSFEKVALAFSQANSVSPPSWVQSNDELKNSSMTGKNIIILDQKFNMESQSIEKFKEFFKAAKDENFCRINVSQCKFDYSDIASLKQLYKLFVDLRRNRVMSILMGDNNLINLCKTYINTSESSKNLKAEFVNNETDFWLLYLEVLQWKGKKDEFEEMAFNYAMKFEVSPPDWDENGTMSLDKTVEIVPEETKKLEKVLTYNNIDSLFNLIKNDLESSNKTEVDLFEVERIDFAGAGSIVHFIQELLSTPQFANKQIIFKNPNEMILVLFEVLGITEFITIYQKSR